MKTVGEILRLSREKKSLSIADISQITKIQPKFILALEKNDYRLLPQSAFVKGFIRNYAQVVGKDPFMLLAVFRRDFGQDAQGKVIPRGLINPLNNSRFRWTPQLTLVAAIVGIITIFGAYLIIQFRSLSGVPSLNLKSPQENATVSSLINVTGAASPQATVTVNSQSVPVQDNGEFTTTISLTLGKHSITVAARSRTGKTTTLQRTVIVE